MIIFFTKISLIICIFLQYTLGDLNASTTSKTPFDNNQDLVWDIVDDTASSFIENNPVLAYWQNFFQRPSPPPSPSAPVPIAQDPTSCKPCRCGTNSTTKRIVGGMETAVNAYPWVGLMLYGIKLNCGSSLINDRYVLTAAHCVQGYNLRMMTVTLLEHDRSNPNETSTIRTGVMRAIVHPEFNASTYNNDIALLRLSRVISFHNELRPVCLPIPRLTFAGEDGIATGWGALNVFGGESETLQEVTVPILSNAECRMTNYGESRITENMMCAGYPMEGLKDACTGDSGGPLHLLRNDVYHIVGIVSWGEGCADPDYPGVYTRVNRFLTWIRTNTIDACYCEI